MPSKRADTEAGIAKRRPRPVEGKKERRDEPDAALPGSATLRAGGVPVSDHPIRARVLQAIARNRVPGLHFAGHFLDIQWRRLADDTAGLAIPDGPHCRDANGTVNIAALGILADNALSTPARFGATPGARLGTVFLQIQFTGAPVTGDLGAEARLLGRSEGAIRQKSMSSAIFSANGKTIGHATGEFVLLEAPPGVTLAPLPWERQELPRTLPVDAGPLEPHERAVLEACDAALARATPQASFIQQFWGGVPRRTVQGAGSRVAIGPHIGNRVGHVQGGILFGLAATSAGAAAPPGMMLSNASAWYISPGCGDALAVRSRVLHTGRTMAVVRTEIKAAGGERVLEALTQHIKRKRD